MFGILIMFTKKEMMYDVIVVGGGPAGMLAAIFAASKKKRVLLLESNNRLGKKLLITGKGRCNVTNNCTVEEVLRNIPRNGRFLYGALNAYPPEAIIAYFEQNGCPLKTERGNRVFPISDRSQSVLDCLYEQLKNLGVHIRYERVVSVEGDESGVTAVETVNGRYETPAVILATGGVSYPATGSTGDGYLFAKRFGHTIVDPTGSLVPLETLEEDCKAMQGLSLRNVSVKLVNANGKMLFHDFGELLFTHFGLSGPTVLSASCHLKGEGCRLLIDLKPALDEGKLNDRILRDLEQYKNRTMENALTDLLPRSMIPVVLHRIDVSTQLQANSFTKQNRRDLVGLLKNFSFTISRKRPVSEAIITSGGIKVSEINPKTMESKRIPGLFFAGEVIDCDGYTGGFNLQIAWSTAAVAGISTADVDSSKLQH